MITTLFANEFRITRKALFASAGVAFLVALGSFAATLLKLPVISGISFGLGIMAVVIILPVVLFVLAESCLGFAATIGHFALKISR